jgi:hypothetical protein
MMPSTCSAAMSDARGDVLAMVIPFTDSSRQKYRIPFAGPGH